MAISSFTEWCALNEGPRYLGPQTSQALQTHTNNIDAEMSAIEAQIKQLKTRHSELDQKKQNLIKGMGGGWVNNKGISQPNDFMKHYDQHSGRRPDLPSSPGHGYPMDYGSTNHREKRAKALKNAAGINNYFSDNKVAADFLQKLLRADPGTYKVPASVSPEDAKHIVKYLIGGNQDYEDFDIYNYDAEDHTIYVGDPSDV